MTSASTKGSELQRQLDLTQFLDANIGGEITDLNNKDNPPWYETGKTYEIPEESYWHFLVLVPPRWMSGSMFAFKEGNGLFRLFWKNQSRYFARELTLENTESFCRLIDASRES